LRRIIRLQPKSDDASQAYELLSRIYLRSGRYSRLVDNFDRWAALFPNRPEVLRERKDIEPFRGLPDQRNPPPRLSTLRHEAGNDWSVPLSINGKFASYLFDTGAWVSVMSEAEAIRLGLEIRPGSASMGDPSGNGFRFRTAVAKDVRLGAMRFRDVSFAVPEGRETFGLLGIPFWLALRHVKWSSAGTWELGGPAAASEPTSRNVVFSGNHFLLATSVSGSRAFAFFDTGAMNTDLNQNFADGFPALMQAVPERLATLSA
jgi:predicted aspartyl protease